MVFSGAVFLYAFLPLTLAVYALAPQRGRNAVLLIASLLFYAFGEPVYVFLLLLSSVSDWALSLCIERRRGTRTAKLALAVSVLLNLGLLGFFKYADFFLTTVNGLFGLSLPLTGVRLPLGISFYTFQTMSYTIDVYRGHVRPQRNLATFATFVCLFPQLIAGPIVRYSDIEAELHTRRFCLEDIGTGARRFTVGLGKKVLLANVLGELVSSAGNATVLGAWLGAVGYLLQIYFDFSGYSDMAIGLGRMFGFTFPENFDYPYLARSVTDFWRRWHQTLGQWFRDYVYIPLGGNRVGKLRHCANLLVTFLVSGLWHGAAFTYIIWGGLHGMLQILENSIPLFRAHIRRVKEGTEKKGVLVISRLVTFFLVMLAWVFFRAGSVSQAVYILWDMWIGIGHPLSYLRTGFAGLGLTLRTALELALLLALLAVYDACSLHADPIRKTETWKPVLRWSFYYGFMLLVILLASFNAQEFVYFQF